MAPLGFSNSSAGPARASARDRRSRSSRDAGRPPRRCASTRPRRSSWARKSRRSAYFMVTSSLHTLLCGKPANFAQLSGVGDTCRVVLAPQPDPTRISRLYGLDRTPSCSYADSCGPLRRPASPRIPLDPNYFCERDERPVRPVRAVLGERRHGRCGGHAWREPCGVRANASIRGAAIDRDPGPANQARGHLRRRDLRSQHVH